MSGCKSNRAISSLLVQSLSYFSYSLSKQPAPSPASSLLLAIEVNSVSHHLHRFSALSYFWVNSFLFLFFGWDSIHWLKQPFIPSYSYFCISQVFSSFFISNYCFIMDGSSFFIQFVGLLSWIGMKRGYRFVFQFPVHCC